MRAGLVYVSGEFIIFKKCSKKMLLAEYTNMNDGFAWVCHVKSETEGVLPSLKSYCLV